MEIYCNNCGTVLGENECFCPVCSNNVRYVNGCSLIEAYKSMWSHYADFNGRARRSEYWLAYAANLIVTLILYIITACIPALGFLVIIYALATLIPNLALCVRRLHDTGRSGHWMWIALTGYGAVALLVFYCQDKKQPINRFGHSSKWYSIYDMNGVGEESGTIQ